MNFEFRGKYLITGKLICETGLHIGGSTEGFEIGGVENPVVKDPLTDQPYIPGSSLKGKLRHLLEWSTGKIEKHPKHGSFTAHFCGTCDACIIFGVASDDTDKRVKAGPPRLTVRDAFLAKDPDKHDPKRFYNHEEIAELLGEENLYTEIKTENTLDRVTSEANPRPMERVPAGAAFQMEMIFDVYCANDIHLLKSLFTAMHLLEDSALGGSGSRGHGKVKFADLEVELRPIEYYRSGGGIEEIKKIPATLKEVVKQFGTVDWRFPLSDREEIEPCKPTQST